jgi:hypothetical protein
VTWLRRIVDWLLDLLRAKAERDAIDRARVEQTQREIAIRAENAAAQIEIERRRFDEREASRKDPNA